MVQRCEFMVVLADQAHLSRAAALRTKTKKARYVYNRLPLRFRWFVLTG